MGFYNDNSSIQKNLDEITVEVGDMVTYEKIDYYGYLLSDNHYRLEDNVIKNELGYTTKIGDYEYYFTYVDTERMFSKQTNLKGIIHVVDTVNPSIVLKSETYEIEYGSQIDVNDIAECVDNSECKLSLINEINNRKVGEQEIIIEAVDEAGNTSQLSTMIKVIKKRRKYRNFDKLNVKNSALNKKLSNSEKISLRQQIIDYAKQFIGNPYVYGGTSLTNGTDCSGFTMSVYAHFGYSLPRVAIDQDMMGKRVKYEDLEIGDLIVYHYNNGGGHVGIYIGNGKMIHAGTVKTGIQITSIFKGDKTYQRIIY